MTLWRNRLSQPAGVNDIELPGCNPTPLASYLKALAVLRLVAEADDEGGGDAQATGFWRDDVFVLRTRLTAEQLVDFFLLRYRPTPLIAPWNAGSGFFFREGKLKTTDPLTGKKLKTGLRDQSTEATKTVLAILNCTSPRFTAYRDAIRVAENVIESFDLQQAPDASSDQKDRFVRAFRNLAPERCVAAMDSAILICSDGTQFPPLFGLGGNDGNLDFSNNFMQRPQAVIGLSSDVVPPLAREGLCSTLFGTPCNSLSDAAIGQFDPGHAGGPNASSGFAGKSRTNAWGFVLMLEGAALFCASAARRLEGDSAVLSAPFVVRSRLGTEGAASQCDDDESHNEMWLPQWSAPSSFNELRALLSEGSAALNGRRARDGLDFARAVSLLGIGRGLQSFQRYAFLKPQGDSYLATPLSRVPVRYNPDSDLISDIERGNWLGAVQGYARDAKAPNAFRSAARRLDAALFALTQQASRNALQAVLQHVGRIESSLATSIKSHEHVRLPAPRLSVAWAIKADDASAEFRIASALAGLCLRDANGHDVLQTRRHLVAVSEAKNRDGDRAWEPASRVAVWATGSLTGNLAALLNRRRLEAVGLGAAGELLASRSGATLEAVADFLERRTEDARINDLLAGLSRVDLHGLGMPRGVWTATLPAAFSVLKIFFTPESMLRSLRWLPEDRNVRLPAELPVRLASNDMSAAMTIAWRRLRALGVDLPGRDPPQVIGADGQRWLAALCIPLTQGETGRLLRDLPFPSPTQRSAGTATDADRHDDIPAGRTPCHALEP